MILTQATNLRVGTTQAITAALQNNSFAAFWAYLTTTISCVISGTIGLFKYGSGTLVLDNPSNSFTGSVTIAVGTISIAGIGNEGANSHLGRNRTINLGSGGNAGILLYTGAGETTDKVINLSGSNGPVTITNNGTGLLRFTSNFAATGGGSKGLTFSGSGVGEIAGVVRNNSSSLTTRIIKSGTGTWTLSAINTYTGTTSVVGGLLRTTALISGTAGKFSQADFTSTSLTVTFSNPPVAGETYRLFPGATVQTYASVSLVGAPDRTATYNSTNSTLTIA